MTKTHKSRIKKWVEALRSGKYKQARGALFSRSANRHYSYCCLGVACKVYQEAKGITWEEASEGDSNSTLPLKVSEWFGFGTEDNPVVDCGDNTISELTDLNDTEKWNFKKIADAIERTFLSRKRTV